MRAVQFCALLALPLLAACSGAESKKDPVANANFENEQRISDQAVTERQEKDAEFLVSTASRSMQVLEMSNIAKRKATVPATRFLADRILGEHSALQTALQNLAKQKSLVLPNRLGEDAAEKLGELTALNGAAFDRKYVELLADVHKTSIDAFDDMSEDAYDGDIRAFAAKYLPILKTHEEAAESTADQLPK